MILRYTCTQCGLWTRVEPGQDHVICRCEAPYDVVEEPGPTDGLIDDH